MRSTAQSKSHRRRATTMGQSLPDSYKVADSVVVRVCKGPGIDFVSDRTPPPTYRQFFSQVSGRPGSSPQGDCKRIQIRSDCSCLVGWRDLPARCAAYISRGEGVTPTVPRKAGIVDSKPGSGRRDLAFLSCCLWNAARLVNLDPLRQRLVQSPAR